MKNLVKKEFQGLEHKKIFRPWGHYESIVDCLNWKVKMITVKPFEQLSLQKHLHRSEHWVVVKGQALVQVDEKNHPQRESKCLYSSRF